MTQTLWNKNENIRRNHSALPFQTSFLFLISVLLLLYFYFRPQISFYFFFHFNHVLMSSLPIQEQGMFLMIIIIGPQGNINCLIAKEQSTLKEIKAFLIGL